jgi:predicted transcriptional regulator
MTTITLTLPDHAVEQAQQFARERDITATAFLEAALLDYLEELEDLEEARMRSAELKSGAVTPRSWEAVKARQLAKPDMAEYRERLTREEG